MLIEFSVENYRSIRERVTLSMIASDEEQLNGNWMAAEGDAKTKLLKTAVLYGANASGKTNVLKAFQFMVDFVVNSHLMQKGDEIGTVPFLLDEESADEPSLFVVMFDHEGTKYEYGFSCDRTQVYEEFLHVFSQGEQQMVFQRSDTDEFDFEEDEEEQEVLAKRTLDNRLYLSTATQFNYERTAKAFEWFKSHIVLRVDAAAASFGDVTSRMIEEDAAVGELVTRFLANASGDGHGDTNGGICGVEVVPSPGSPRHRRYDVFVQHLLWRPHGAHRIVKMRLDEESHGTQRLYALAGDWIRSLKQGQLLLIDEFDNSVHPRLLAQMVRQFHSTTLNNNGAQLIFTSQNTSLIDDTIYRRDQVWLASKNTRTGATDLRSLLQYRRVPGEDLEKSYLAGRFGAVPIFNETR